jgi:hypothetical protein
MLNYINAFWEYSRTIWRLGETRYLPWKIVELNGKVEKNVEPRYLGTVRNIYILDGMKIF